MIKCSWCGEEVDPEDKTKGQHVIWTASKLHAMHKECDSAMCKATGAGLTWYPGDYYRGSIERREK